MTRILYGLSGEGRGHSSRARIIIEKLLETGHEVRIVSSRQGYRHLSDCFQVEEICGLRICFHDNRVAKGDTLKDNAGNMFRYGPRTVSTLYGIIQKFRPELAITDFEPGISIASKLAGIPLIAIDHQSVISRCRPSYKPRWRWARLISYLICQGISGFTDHTFVTSFYFPEVKAQYRASTTLVGPILRHEVVAESPWDGDHLLVYVSNHRTGRRLLPHLRRLDYPVIAYGYEDGQISGDNISFKSPSVNGFLRDLATCRAVIANGGYSLLSEALFLGKPVYSLPISMQFEQMLNAHYLEERGYGFYEINPSPDGLRGFCNNISRYHETISRDATLFNANGDFFPLLESKIAELTSGQDERLRSCWRQRWPRPAKILLGLDLDANMMI